MRLLNRLFLINKYLSSFFCGSSTFGRCISHKFCRNLFNFEPAGFYTYEEIESSCWLGENFRTLLTEKASLALILNKKLCVCQYSVVSTSKAVEAIWGVHFPDFYSRVQFDAKINWSIISLRVAFCPVKLLAL